MRAVVLAGGKGTRLKPYTTTLPKPLVPVGERSILDVMLMQLKRAGVTRVTMAVNHLAHLIMAYYGDGTRFELAIDYSLEDTPLSTIAPLTLIKDLPEVFLMMNGDILTDIDYAALYREHCRTGADVTVATFERDSKIDFGVLTTDADGLIVGFEEKPVYRFQVSMGIYVLSRRLLDIVPTDRPFGFDDLMHACITRRLKARRHLHSGFWLDIGRPDDYALANEKVDELVGGLFESPTEPR